MSNFSKHPSLTPEEEAIAPTTAPERLRELAQENIALARLVAQNPAAPPKLLEELVKENDRPLWKSLAGNPNTPIDTLFKVAAEFPEEFLENPIFSLLLLEDPNLIARMPSETQLSILTQEKVPGSFLDWGINYLKHSISDKENMVKALLANPNLAEKHFQQILNPITNRKIQLEVEEHIKFSEELESGWEEIANQSINNYRYTESINKTSDETELNIIITLFPKLFLHYYKNDDWLIKHFLNNSNYNHPMLLDEFSQNKSHWIRLLVASNRNITDKILERLAWDNYSQVRLKVAENPKTTARLIDDLVQYIEWHPTVLKALVQHPNTSISSLIKLAKSEDKEVVDLAEQRLKKIQELKEFERDWQEIATGLSELEGIEQFYEMQELPEQPAILLALAQDPGTPDHLLRKLADYPDLQIQYAVATNAQTPSDIVEDMIKNDDLLNYFTVDYIRLNQNIFDYVFLHSPEFIRQELAKNPYLSKDMMITLLKTQKFNICEALLENPSVSWEVIEYCLRDRRLDIPLPLLMRYLEEKPSGVPLLLSYLAERYQGFWSRLFILLHPETPSEVLEKNRLSLEWLHRYAVAQHQNTPIEALKSLANDGNRVVRAAAKDRLKKF
jgi:hypothetical protein